MSQRDNPRLALNNITAGVRECEDANRTRVAGHLDEVQGIVTNILDSFRNGAVGFIDWLGTYRSYKL
jgi:putative aminopeptidase FrvX